MMAETDEARLKRMKMRSWRRGTKEMDLILGPFADSHLAALNGADLALYDQLLEENDHDLYQWLSGQREAPEALRDILAVVAKHAKTR
jgi:antitoxin CptB